jgi:hypothetical protein
VDRISEQFQVLIFISVLASFASSKTLGTADTFAAARFTEKEITQLIPVLEELAYDIPDSWNSELRAKRIDLGNSPGVVLEGTNLLCGATGNCQIFVFRKVKDRWISLFQGEAPIGDAFTFGPGTRNGIKDLSVRSNESADTAATVTYRFDGQFYRSK